MLGIPAALNADATVTARCRDGCNQEIVLEIKDGALASSEGIVNFGVPAARWWENIGFARSTMLIFRSEDHIDERSTFRELPRGGIMSP